MLHAANQGAASRFDQARAVFELVGADPERVRPVGTDRHPRPAPRPPYSALGSEQSAAAGLTPLRPWRDALADAALVGRPATLYAVTPSLIVVTVTYSPGPHLDRFLASLGHATERPVTVVMADNGSDRRRPRGGARAVSRTPGCCAPAPTWATARGQPGGARVPGGRSPKTVADGDPEFFVVANPDVRVGPRQHRRHARGGAAVAAGRVARPTDPRSRRFGLPVGPAPAEPGPRRHARRRRSGLEVEPVDGRLPPGADWSPANVPSAGCPGRVCCCAGPAFDAIARVRRALFHVHGGRRPRRSSRRGGLAERLRADGGDPARQGTLDRPRPGPQLGGPPHQHLHFPG